jgi:hypothetical protein
MVDTIQCFGESFKVKDWSKWSQHSITDRATGEVKQKEVCNSDKVSATIYGSKLIFHSSLPKLLYGSNLFELKQSDGERAVEAVEKELFDSCGVRVAEGLKDFRLSRIDFCRNLKVNHSIPDYIQALSQLRYSRREKVLYKSETLSFRNGRRELCFYDKVGEVRGDKKLSPELLEYVNTLPNNLLRVEAKLRRASVVKKEYGEKGLSDFLSGELSVKKLCGEYDSLVKSDSEQLEFNFKQNLETIEYIKLHRKKGAIGKFLELKGTQQLLAECNFDWTVVKELLSEAVGERTAYRWLSRLKENHTLLLLNIEESRELLLEIKQKLSMRLVA